MRGHLAAILALAVGLTTTQTAASIGHILDCEDNPSATDQIELVAGRHGVHRRFGDQTEIAIVTTAETGVTITVSARGVASVGMDKETLLEVVDGTGSIHISTVFPRTERGYLDLATDGEATFAFACTSNAPDTDPISQMEGQSTFQRGNFASSGASFQSLLNGEDPFGDQDPGSDGQPMAFAPDQARATEALEAIQGSFALLGYGPNATLTGDAYLAVGEDWFVKGLVKGTISQTDVSGGTLNRIGGKVSVLAQRHLPDGKKFAVALTGGLGHATAPGQSDESRSLSLDGAFAVPLTDTLLLIGGANYGLAAHDVDLGSATGSYVEQMTSASLTLRGDHSIGALTLTPALTGNLGYGWQPDFTDSGATTHAGGAALAASIDAGVTLAYDLPAQDGMQVSPFAGIKASAFRRSYAENGGATTETSGIGGEVELGLKTRFDDGAEIGIRGTLGQQGDTRSASLTGSLGGRF